MTETSFMHPLLILSICGGVAKVHCNLVSSEEKTTKPADSDSRADCRRIIVICSVSWRLSLTGSPSGRSTIYFTAKRYAVSVKRWERTTECG